MQSQINLDLKPTLFLLTIFFVVNAVLIVLVQFLPLSADLKAVFSMLLLLLTVILLLKIIRDNHCQLICKEGSWRVRYALEAEPINTPRVRFISAYWLVLSIKREGDFLERTVYLSPRQVGDKDFRGLCRYFRFNG